MIDNPGWNSGMMMRSGWSSPWAGWSSPYGWNGAMRSSWDWSHMPWTGMWGSRMMW